MYMSCPALEDWQIKCSADQNVHFVYPFKVQAVLTQVTLSIYVATYHSLYMHRMNTQKATVMEYGKVLNILIHNLEEEYLYLLLT